ncbi:putative multidrug efflux outer membrane protein [Brachyspira pilosicoli WesB]|uniref:TolC family protein n=6 Tax=Brachyspira pilosicoli TaxID=52584 RepID=A0AAJ6K7Q7_BRAPL|nr:TolC family protein [Brachyspira pilosicoli]ADK31128.1 putative outer membrane component of multidrug efflux [Brachyspira pilosicoli 95/1000]AGA67070.1 putative multidrug efflux outer membrane protein [Brachyspira pilosicoli P43/6/78]PLV55408.1 multidrug transporter [Brachyspira pilosicoli SP16]WIH80867.1 TolC family protein [Brachyspira pilosicoli]WIH83074.1 TolC family protein [Brachyspira pilosicoli]
MSKKLLYYFTAFLFLLSSSIYTQTNAEILSYAEYIERIKNIIPEMKLTAIQESNAYNNLTKAKSSGDVKFDLQAGAIGTQKHFDEYNIIPTADFMHNGMRIGAGFSGLIPYSGTRWSVKIQHDSYFGDLKMGEVEIPVDTPLGTVVGRLPNLSTNNFKYYAPSIEIQIAQPILRDFFGKLDMYPIKDAEYQLTIAKLKRIIDDNSVLTSYQKIYYQWIMSQKLIKLYDEMIREAKAFENQIYKRYTSGVIDNDAYQNARRQTLKYREARNKSELILKKIIRNIQFFIPEENVEPNEDDWESMLETSINTKINVVPFLESAQGQMAYQLKLRSEYALSIMKNNSLPDLSIVGSVSLSTLDDSGYFNSFSTMTNVEYFVGLMFSYPIGGRDAKAKMEDAYNALTAVTADFDRVNRDFDVQIGTYYDEFEAYKTMLEDKKLEVQALASRVRTQNERFRQGRLPVDEIINARLDLVNARAELLNLEYMIISTVMDYNSLVLLNN